MKVHMARNVVEDVGGWFGRWLCRADWGVSKRNVDPKFIDITHITEDPEQVNCKNCQRIMRAKEETQ